MTQVSSIRSHGNVFTEMRAHSSTARWVVIAASIVVLSLCFAAYSGQVWEDYYITYRSSRHLAEGSGLVYQIGEHVHTFTSPLGVLIPAAGFFFFKSDTFALWFLRILSSISLAGAGVLVLRYAVTQSWPRIIRALIICLGVLEAKLVAFSTNGMETAFLTFFFALAWYELNRGKEIRALRLGLAYGGLLWTRPDAFVIAAAITASTVLFREGRKLEIRYLISRIAIAGIVGGGLYLPWFVWAWMYYGSPIPQTVLAKSALAPADAFHFSRFLAAPLRCLVSNTAMDGLFMPIYYNAGGWPRDFVNFGRLLARLSAFLWLVPACSRATRASSFAVLLGGIYFHQIKPYPWYYGPWTLLAAVALCGGAQTVLLVANAKIQSLARIAIAALACISLGMTAVQAYTLKIQQQLIEESGRKQIGLWLKNKAHPGDTVFLEPIGYIGYFSQLKILDFPGLCSPEVSHLVKAGHLSYDDLIRQLRPNWLVLRPLEIFDQHLDDNSVLKDYIAVGSWDQQPELDARAYLPSRNWLQFDAKFLAFRRRDDAR